MAMMADDPEHPDVFLLTDTEHGETNKHNRTKETEMTKTRDHASENTHKFRLSPLH